MPVTTEPATWTAYPGAWAKTLESTEKSKGASGQASCSSRTEHGLSASRKLAAWPAGWPLRAQIRNASIFVDGDLRTSGIAVCRPRRRATDLKGLDLAQLTAAAAWQPEAAATGKLLVLGQDGAAVFQTKSGRRPELAWCGNITAAVARLLGADRVAFSVFGPGGGIIDVVQTRDDARVEQAWAAPALQVRHVRWRGLSALISEGLNTYAVVIGEIPAGVSLEQARHELVGDRLSAKLAVVSPRGGEAPMVVFFNGHGRHGAAPATGMAQLSMLGRISPALGHLLKGGLVTFVTKSGPQTVALPKALTMGEGVLTILMPPVDVEISTRAAAGAR